MADATIDRMISFGTALDVYFRILRLDASSWSMVDSGIDSGDNPDGYSGSIAISCNILKILHKISNL